MKTAIEIMVDFVLLVLFILIAAGFILLHLYEQKARNFHSLAINEIENSHFSKTIEEGLIMEAESQGYALSIREKKMNGEPMAEVVLEYKYHVPLLQFFDTRRIRGTAR